MMELGLVEPGVLEVAVEAVIVALGAEVVT